LLHSSQFKKIEAHLRESRIDRLAFLRSWQKNKLAQQVEMVKSLDAVVVIDLDLLSLPSEEALSTAITTVNTPDKESVVCANGYEKWLFTRHYYDTFALIFEDGTWGWPMLTSIKSIIFFLQHDFHKKIRASNGNFAVQSCFGGLAVYEPSQFFHPTCNYRISDPSPEVASTIKMYSNSNGEACEHVVLHMCLREDSKENGSDPTFKIGESGLALKIARQLIPNTNATPQSFCSLRSNPAGPHASEGCGHRRLE
jgi:hypothetical protein